MVEIPLLASPPGERNRISLHSTRSGDLGWVEIRQLNFVVSGPNFIKFWSWRSSPVNMHQDCRLSTWSWNGDMTVG